jgi:hypothetical protein
LHFLAQRTFRRKSSRGNLQNVDLGEVGLTG